MSYVTQDLHLSDGVKHSLKYRVKSVYMKAGSHLYRGRRICELISENEETITVKAKFGGVVSKAAIKVGDNVYLGDVVLEVKACLHPTILGNICCDCGVVLEERTHDHADESRNKTLVSMLHSIPDLKVSKEEATRVGNEDIKHLLDKRKLVLLVDLDQTLIHTTNDNIPPKLKDVFHFQLIQNGPWYHTRLRPYTERFLRNISEFYELHICTFGVREYAHSIATFLDPEHKLFGDRILSRNECLDPMSKKANLSSLFPCGDNLVCIIDDRSDVWNFAPNVVQVMPYHFFQHTGDINAPPELQKKENDNISMGYDFSNLEELSSLKDRRKKESSNLNDESDNTDLNDKKDGHELEVVSENSENAIKDDSDVHQSENDKSSHDDPVKTETNPEEKSSKPDRKESGNNHQENEEKDVDECEDEVVTNKSTDSETLDVEDNDDYLLYLEDILKKLHKYFYEIYETSFKRDNILPDLKEIVPNIRKTVLNDCHLVLSGIVPQNTSLTDSKAYHIATSLGASLSDKIISNSKRENDHFDQITTHVIAANLHTEKVHQAKKLKHIKIVTPNWLWSCAERWERVDERLFRLTEDSEKSIVRNPPMHCFINLNKPSSNDFILSANSVSEKDMTSNDFQEKSESLFESLNPLVYMSNDETKSMEDEVDDLLDSDEVEEDKLEFQNKEQVESSESEDNSHLENRERTFNDDDEDEDDDDGDDDDDDDENVPSRNRKRKRNLDDDDYDDDDDEEEELPSIRFRQGGSLPSDENDGDSCDEDMGGFGDILERELMRE